MTPHRLFSCFHPSSHPLVLGVARVVVPAVVLVVVPAVELLVKDLVLSSEFLKVCSEISYLFLHRSHLRRLATGGKRLSMYFHRSRPDHAVLLYRCGERQICAFPQTAPTDVSRKPVDGSQGVRQSGRPAKRNEITEFRVFSSLFIPEYGGKMAFYAFWSSTWPSGGRRILVRVGGFITLRLAGSGQIVPGVGQRCEDFIPGIRGRHLCSMRCRSGEVSYLISVGDKDGP
uniref:Uncharacterized protein n=1 Tax=Fagus sylvatica TaxID=28930 RepID=A0A2N9IQW6_FAGSY